MEGANIMKRMFSLHLVFLKTNDENDKKTLKNEIDLLHKELDNSSDIPEQIKKYFYDILRQYEIIYSSDRLVEKYEAEDQVRELLDKIKEFIELQ